MKHRIAIDLTRRFFQRVTRGYVITGTWRLDQSPPEPCLVVTLPYRAISFERTTPCVVPLRSAHIWAGTSRKDHEHVAEMCGEFLAALGERFSGPAAIQLALAVHDHIPDLLMIPPYSGEREVVGEVTRTGPDGKVHEDTIMERI
jgi:hypothetical protein